MILHYFYDPLCGWCYGFSKTIKTFYENHKHEMDFEVISGGMVKGEHEKPISDMAPFLRGAFKQVENTTGVKFGQAFLDRVDEGTTILSSVPGSIAMSVFKSYHEDKAILYAADIQHAIYSEGVAPMDEAAFAEIASKYGIQTTEFLEKMKDDYFRKDAYDDFSVTQQFGVTGYPTTVLFYKEEYFLLSKGYTSLEVLEKTLESVLNSYQ